MGIDYQGHGPCVLPSIVPLRILGVIPARYASSRFPGKALVSIAGKPMLQHVWERASQARYLTDIVVATDDDRIRQAASASTATVIVNIQGDEPMIDPFAIDAAVLGMLHDENIPMGTLKKRIEQPHEIDDPGVVKVVTDQIGNALYFSRSPIPFH